MITLDAAATRFKAILAQQVSWASLATSQIVDHLAVFVAWCLREALWRVERVYQEYFLSTAINDSSVYAHAEDRAYFPRLRTPAKGSIVITNSGTAAANLTTSTIWQSDTLAQYVATTSGVSIAAGATTQTTIQVVQEEERVYTHTVTATQEFYTVMLAAATTWASSSAPWDDTADTLRLADHINVAGVRGPAITVSVTTGGTTTLWTYKHMFQNVEPDDKVYDIFFTHTGLFGIRFGNGDALGVTGFGARPNANDTITITLQLTEGDTTLLQEQSLTLVSPSPPPGSNLSATVAATVNGGSEREGIEETRTSLRYWSIFADMVVWDNDYLFFLRRGVTGMTWVKVWGEETQELYTGVSMDNVNRIFVSAYKPYTSNAILQGLVLARLNSLGSLCLRYVWVDPNVYYFDVAITGTVGQLEDTAAIEAAITSLLQINYGVDSPTRRATVEESDLYALVSSTGFFLPQLGTSFVVNLTLPTIATPRPQDLLAVGTISFPPSGLRNL